MSPSLDQAIGIFDSGIGGLTVFQAIAQLLPNENLVYLGDTARVPYGSKSRETVVRYSVENAQFLLKTGVKMIVVACNTASAYGLGELQARLNVPVIGVLKPGAETAVAKTRSKEVGVIGTDGTISSGSYLKAIQEIDASIRVWGVACPLFVPLVEEGWLEDPITEQAIQKYLSPFLKTPIDTLILGCTHYPLLASAIAKVMGNKIQLVDSAQATAWAVLELLKDHQMERQNNFPRTETLFVTDSPDRFRQVGRNFLGRPLDGVTLISF